MRFFDFLTKFCDFFNIQLENFVDFEKCCKMRIWMQNFVSIQTRTSLKKSDVSWPVGRGPVLGGRPRRGPREGGPTGRCFRRAPVFDSEFFSQKCQTLEGSFSAASTPICEIKYSFQKNRENQRKPNVFTRFANLCNAPN